VPRLHSPRVAARDDGVGVGGVGGRRPGLGGGARLRRRRGHPRSAPAQRLVLSLRGGLLHQLLPVARLGVLQRFGSGTELMSWISLSDEIAAIRFLLDHGDVSGPVNLTAPDPVINSAFAAALDHMLHRPDLPWLRAPAWLLRAALGE